MRLLFYILFPIISYFGIMLIFGLQFLFFVTFFSQPALTYFEKRKKEGGQKNRFSFGCGFNHQFPKLPLVLLFGVGFVLKPLNRISLVFGLISIFIIFLYTIIFIFNRVLQPVNNLYFFLIGIKHYAKTKIDKKYNRDLFHAFLLNYFFVVFWFLISFFIIILIFALLYKGCEYLFPNSFIKTDGSMVNSLFDYFYISLKVITTAGLDVMIKSSWGRVIEITEILTGVFIFVISFGFIISTFVVYFKKFKEVYIQIERSERESMDFIFNVINFVQEAHYIGEKKEWGENPFSPLGKSISKTHKQVTKV